ncbi:MAG: beta-ketoacyl reductase, partial [Myxococcota bacterium]
NAFLDALAHHRRAQGLPAISVDWGAWGDTGMASTDEVSRAFESRGFAMMPPESGMRALERLLEHNPVQRVVLDCQWSTIASNNYPGPTPAMLDTVLEAAMASKQDQTEGGTAHVDLVQLLTSTEDPDQRQSLLEENLTGLVARVLHMDGDDIDVEQPLVAAGVDSMMALELRNRIESTIGVGPTVVELLQGVSLRDLADRLLQRLPLVEPEVVSPANVETEDDTDELLAALSQLSSEEAAALLADASAEKGEIDL